ncbi:MAG: N-acetylneuraminic acid synthase [Myxococcales bacterium]|nr:N-acetylneuraminic acid synthase [Myxococcales bacterium]
MEADVSDRNAGGRICRPGSSRRDGLGPASSGLSRTGRWPVFVAEVSSNHHRDLDRCLAFVDRAAEIGCDAVKFQLFRVRELFAPEVLAASPDHQAREQWELPVAFLAPLAERAHARGIAFGCSPFDLRAVDELEPFVDFYKVASYELLWDPLISACAGTGRPLILSTGMADGDEVGHAIEVAAKAGCTDLTVLHCVSTYPMPAGEANLGALETLRGLAPARVDPIAFRVGWSDHSLEPGILHRAIHGFGAELVEFHLDLEGQGEEFGAGHCWLPDAIGEVIRQVRAALAADGDGRKRPAPSEQNERSWRADPRDGLRPLRDTRKSLGAWP